LILTKLMNNEELQFEQKVKIILKVIIFSILKVFLSGMIILTIIAFVTGNNALVYPYGDEANRNMIIQVIVLGLIFMGVFPPLKRLYLKVLKKTIKK